MLKKKTIVAVLLLTFGSALPALAHGDEHAENTFDQMSESYLSIQTSLAGDSLDGMKGNAEAINSLAGKMDKKFDNKMAGVEEKDVAACRKLMPTLAASSRKLADAKDIKAARAAFGDLSEAMVEYRNMVPGEKPNVAYCPMVKKNWLQNGKKVSNPYFGSSMLRCGSIVADKSEGGHGGEGQGGGDHPAGEGHH